MDQPVRRHDPTRPGSDRGPGQRPGYGRSPAAGARVAPCSVASFALRPEQVEQIRRVADQRGVSQSALIREAVDLYVRETVRLAIERLDHARGELAPLFPLDGTAATTPALDQPTPASLASPSDRAAD